MTARKRCIQFVSLSLNKINAKELAKKYHKDEHKRCIAEYLFFLNRLKLVSKGTQYVLPHKCSQILYCEKIRHKIKISSWRMTISKNTVLFTFRTLLVSPKPELSSEERGRRGRDGVKQVCVLPTSLKTKNIKTDINKIEQRIDNAYE